MAETCSKACGELDSWKAPGPWAHRESGGTAVELVARNTLSYPEVQSCGLIQPPLQVWCAAALRNQEGNIVVLLTRTKALYLFQQSGQQGSRGQFSVST